MQQLKSFWLDNTPQYEKETKRIEIISWRLLTKIYVGQRQLIQTGFEQNMDNLELQWGSEIGTPINFEWSKRGWFANGQDFEWDLKSRSPTI